MIRYVEESPTINYAEKPLITNSAYANITCPVTTQVVRFKVHSCPVLDTGLEPWDFEPVTLPFAELPIPG